MKILKTISITFFILTISLLAQEQITLVYDRGETDGSLTFGLDGWYFTTRFTPPAEALVEKARFYIADTSNGATYHLSIYHDTDGFPAGAISPVDKLPMRVKRLGWNEIDLTSYNVVKDEDFYLSIEYDFESEISIGVDREEDRQRMPLPGELRDDVSDDRRRADDPSREYGSGQREDDDQHQTSDSRHGSLPNARGSRCEFVTASSPASSARSSHSCHRFGRSRSRRPDTVRAMMFRKRRNNE